MAAGGVGKWVNSLTARVAIRLAWLVIGLLVPLVAAPALALDPSRSLAQLGHSAWTVEDGAPTNIRTLAQTPDGYLWIGTTKGLYRFDGVRFDKLPAFQGAPAKSDGITALMTARNGDLWVGHLWGGLSILQDGRLRDMNPAPPYGVVYRIVQTKDGAIWSAVNGIHLAGLRRYLDGRWDIIKAGDRGLPKVELSDVLAARDGSLWVALVDRIVRLKPGEKDFELVDDKVHEASGLAEDAAGRVWILDARGARPLNGKVSRQTLGAQRGNREEFATGFIADRQGELWASNQKVGLIRIRKPAGTSPITQGTERLIGDQSSIGLPAALLEDREGNVWLGANRGLHRFRAESIASYAQSPSPAALGGQHIVFLPAKGEDFYLMWDLNYVRSFDRIPHLYLNHKGRWTNLSDRAAQASTACVGTDGTLWIADRKGLSHFDGARLAGFLPWPPVIKGGIIGGCRQDKLGRIWVARFPGGLFRFDNQVWSHFQVDPQTSTVWPYAWAIDPQGRVLIYHGTRALVRVDGDRVEELLNSSQIDIRFVNAIYCKGTRIVLGGEGGIMENRGNGFKTLSASRFPFLAHVAGIVQTKGGETWIISAEGLLRFRTKDLDWALDHPEADLKHRVFDFHDGLAGEVQENGDNGLFEASDGRIWMGTTDAIAWIDPTHLHHNDLPPTTLLRSISVNGVARTPQAAVVLPANVNKLQIDYTATSLTAPERVRFRYKLEGVDKEWVDAGGRRQAFYTNLKPGGYRFRVIAANDDGVWNTAGPVMYLRIPPTFFQSKWFLALCAMAAAASLWLLYRLRMHQVAERLRLRHRERMDERERIARELHDTLLQGLQGLIFRFQAAAAYIPAEQKARGMMDQALDHADQVIAEGRDRVVELRRTRPAGVLSQMLEASAERILVGSGIETRLIVGGQPQGLSAAIEEEVISIAEEFLFNTLQHSGASLVSIVLNYGRGSFSAEFSDDGRGIDPDVLRRGGRDGHFGLPGMRERARKIGADFDLANRPGAGMAISMRIAGARAYTGPEGGRRMRVRGILDTVFG